MARINGDIIEMTEEELSVIVRGAYYRGYKDTLNSVLNNLDSITAPDSEIGIEIMKREIENYLKRERKAVELYTHMVLVSIASNNP